MIKLGIGSPTTGLGEWRTAFSLLSAALSTANVEILPLLGIGCYIHHNRDVVVRQALENNCTHLLFVDTDGMFGPDVINRLLAHGLDIVGCRYNKKILPIESTVKQEIDKLSEVPFVPTGLLMIKTDVFRKIGKPWFSFNDLNIEEFFRLNSERFKNGEPLVWPAGVPFEYNPAESEDVYFCDKAKRNGYKIYCEPEIQVGHLGTAVF